MRRHTYILGIISFILLLWGIFYWKYQLIQGDVVLFGFLTLFLFAFTISYAIDRVRSQQRKTLQVSTIILYLCFPTLMIGILFQVMGFTGSTGMYTLGTILFAVYFIFFSSTVEGRKLQLRRNRQLVAILFTDIIGFTSMMGDDENSALDMLGINRKIQKQLIRKHRGKWIKELGDGSMVIFYTATEAVQAALEIQESIQETGKFQIRMGIHLSEIVFTDADVFGDGVNVASRIADKAAANEIWISDAVYQNVRNRENINFSHQGELSFKNVSYKLGVYKIQTSM